MKLRLCRGPRAGLALLLLALAGPWAVLEAQEPPGEDFGRWEGPLRRCRIVSTSSKAQPQPTTCRVLRLDQQMEGLLTVRFLQPGSTGDFLDRQLVFAGVLEEGSRGMQCQASRCEPRWPLRLRVSAVGQAGSSEATAAMGLTRAQLASGHCQLDGRAFRCQAVGPDGQQWQADASP